MSNTTVGMEGLVSFDHPVTVPEAVAVLPPRHYALGWGKQALSAETVKAMILLASKLSEHYRYALAVSVDMAQYLYDNPRGGTVDTSGFIRSPQQQDTLIGVWNAVEVHVIQQMPDPDLEEEYLMLLILDDDKMVDSYLLSQLRVYTDHTAPDPKQALTNNARS